MADGNNSLIAYYTVSDGIQLTEADIRAYLTRHLPEYMVPARLIEVHEMPLSPTGKIDRKQLAEMDVAIPQAGHYAPPENDVQQRLADAWAHVLGLERVGIHDNFFHIGGHSLKVLEILVQVKKHLPALKIQDFFQHPTIAELDDYLCNVQVAAKETTGRKADIARKVLKETSPLSSHQTAKPLPMHTVLLTGATGYLGSHVLYELLVETNAHIYCLIRPGSQVTPKEKLNEQMQFYFGKVGIAMMEDRVTVIQGI